MNTIPNWLIFPDNIVQCDKILHIEKCSFTNAIKIYFADKSSVTIIVPDLDKSWLALQHVFAIPSDNSPQHELLHLKPKTPDIPK